MHTKDFAAVLSSWIRLPVTDISSVIRLMGRADLLGDPGTQITFDNAARCLVGLMVASMGREFDLSQRIRDTCEMSMEGPSGLDPLDLLPRAIFSKAVGQTIGMRSHNGYIDFSETLAATMMRLRSNLGTTEIERITISTWGSDVVGSIDFSTKAAPSTQETFPDTVTGRAIFPYTKGGAINPRTGILREVSINKATLHGIAFLMDAQATLSH